MYEEEKMMMIDTIKWLRKNGKKVKKGIH